MPGHLRSCLQSSPASLRAPAEQKERLATDLRGLPDSPGLVPGECAPRRAGAERCTGRLDPSSTGSLGRGRPSWRAALMRPSSSLGGRCMDLRGIR